MKLESAIIGFLGVIVGAFLGEYFRRKNRIEAYSHKVFDRRLKVHEELYSMFVSAYEIICEVMGNKELDHNECICQIYNLLVQSTQHHRI